ncbi:hypothetical protein [Pelagibacterium sp.]|uniref:hypothetical protein n=1 Tax=Pelagibacterium sp. TaxID=1967288 RepID=UPI003A905944
MTAGTLKAAEMGTKLARDLPLIAPIFSHDGPGTSIHLAEGQVTLETKGKTYTGKGQARLETAPDERLKVTWVADTAASADWWRVDDRDDLIMRFGPRGKPINMLVTRTAYTSEGAVTLDMIPKSGAPSQFRDRRVKLAQLVVHILNFPLFIGPDDILHNEAVGGSRRLGRVVFANADWSVEMQELPTAKKTVEQLKTLGGNAMTHIAEIRRANGRMFSIGDAERVVYGLHQFLSFARGHATSVFGAVGFDREGGRAYEQWGTFPSTSWVARTSWFDVHHAEALTALFPGFMKVRDHPQTAGAVSKALYWYLRSNRGGSGMGTDGALILSQAALEGLSTTALTVAGIPLPNTAADKIRGACIGWGIPTAIPAELKKLRSGRRKGAWADGPEALTRVRNDLVHSGRRSSTPLGPVVPETWRLAQWYLELAILRMCGYAGNHSSRLTARWVGEVSPVPWAPRTRSR